MAPPAGLTKERRARMPFNLHFILTRPITLRKWLHRPLPTIRRLSNINSTLVSSVLHDRNKHRNFTHRFVVPVYDYARINDFTAIDLIAVDVDFQFHGANVGTTELRRDGLIVGNCFKNMVLVE